MHEAAPQGPSPAYSSRSNDDMGLPIVLGSALLTRGLGSRAGSVARRFIPGVGLGAAGGAGAGLLKWPWENGSREPRRRRRKALTDTDVRSALTIASAISKKAAENFILMRVRGG
jgi:hypothetical protein